MTRRRPIQLLFFGWFWIRVRFCPFCRVGKREGEERGVNGNEGRLWQLSMVASRGDGTFGYSERE